ETTPSAAVPTAEDESGPIAAWPPPLRLAPHHGLIVIEHRQRQHRTGRQLHAIELRIIPRLADFEQLRGRLRLILEQFLLFLEQAHENVHFPIRRRPAGRHTEYPGDALLRRRAAFFQHSLAEEARRLDDLRIVEQRQCLQRRAGALTADDADVALGGVE